MQTLEPTLKERAGRMYRQLLLLQRLFQRSQETDDAEWLGSGGGSRDVALCAAVREVIDELTAHAETLVSIPYPVSEWRPGDSSDDDRWRALTEIERRSVLSMLAAYDNLITWSEQLARGPVDMVAWPEAGGSADGQPRKLPEVWQKLRDATDYLNGERTRVARFRQEMAFLEGRHRATENEGRKGTEAPRKIATETQRLREDRY
jgi:hypothetical protein